MWDTDRSYRIKILTAVMIGIITLLLLRLAWMQLMQGVQYKKIAEQNRTRQVTAQAPRGTVYDRNGSVLVSSRPSFAISIVPVEYTNARDATPILADITGLTQAQIEKMLADGGEFPYTPIRLMRDIDAAIIAKIEERKHYLPGVMIEAIPVRYYVYKELAAHMLGFVGLINEREYGERKQKGYHPNDLIGKDGVERTWEEALRGIDGGRQVEVNAMGEEIRAIGDRPPIPGNGLVLTLDANLQKAAEQALEAQIEASKKIGQPAKGGAVIVLDVRSGAVLALASRPAFDPNLFSAGITSRAWQSLINNPNNPLNNRVIQNTYPPGSVFKIVTATAALDMGLTNTEEIFDDKGVYVLNGWHFYGWETKGLGKLTLIDAIAWSSDPAFYELGRRLGVDNLATYALTFGLGTVSGINLIGEEQGLVPTERWKEETYGEKWYPGETLIAAIGQGYYLTTPLQQVMLVMAVANGGIMYRPMLVDKVLTPEGNVLEKYQPEVYHTVYLTPEIWGTLREGLSAVTTRGTAASVFRGFSKTVAGKTGSAETGRGTVHSWFACYAPTEVPEIAVAVLVEDGGEGSVAAAPVVRKVLEAYFGMPVTQPLATPPQGKTD